MSLPPRLLISACLLGQGVRYDGGHKFCPQLAALGQVRWVPVCPEVLAGFGVPRAPMELRYKDGVTIVSRCSDGLDMTEGLRGACLHIAQTVLTQDIRGALVKSGSPSCAPGGAPVFSEHGGSPRQDGVGLLVQVLRELLPSLPIMDEAAFEDSWRRAEFLRQVGGN